MLCKAIKTLKVQLAKDYDGVFFNHLKLALSSFLIALLAYFNLLLTTGLVPSSFYIDIVTPIPKLALSSFLIALLAYFNLLLTTGLVPSSFYIDIVTPIPKSEKKDLSSCSSWRPITRSSMIGKVFKLCLKDLLEILDVGFNQVGFKRGLGCDHAHASFSKVTEEARIFGQPLYALLVDIKRALDNISHVSALLALIHAGLALAVIRFLRSWYSRLKVRIGPSSFSSQSKLIRVGRGIRQGGITSSYIFNSYLATALNSLSCSFVSLSRNLSYIAYADDIILLSWSKSSLVSNFNILINCLEDL